MRRVLRSFAERVSRPVVLPRRLPREFGRARIYVAPDSSLRFWLPGWHGDHADLLRYARELVEPGFVVWDIGANVGVFSLASAWRAGPAGRVVAVEPDPRLVLLLGRSVRSAPSGMAAIRIVSAAVADGWDLSEFHIVRRGRSSNYLTIAGGGTQTGGSRETFHVATVSLDAMLERESTPHLVKLDVEGGEHLVLSHASRLLSEARPLLLCEVTRHHEAIAELLGRHGYQMFDADSDRGPSLVRPAKNTFARPS